MRGDIVHPMAGARLAPREAGVPFTLASRWYRTCADDLRVVVRWSPGMDPLSEILDIEQETGRRLAEEQTRAAQWLQDVRLTAAQSAGEETARIRSEAADAERLMREKAAQHAAAIVKDARALAEQLQALDEERLRSVVWKHIAAIAPGQIRDRQNVENRSDRAEGPADARARHDRPLADDACRRDDSAAHRRAR